MQILPRMFMMTTRNQVILAENPKTIVLKSNVDNKTKIMVVGDSLIKYLRLEELSSKKKSVIVIKHPGSTNEDMLDYIKSIARRKPDTSIIHTGMNDRSGIYRKDKKTSG